MYALRCAVLQCCNADNRWHAELEQVNNGGGEGRSAGQLRAW